MSCWKLGGGLFGVIIGLVAFAFESQGCDLVDANAKILIRDLKETARTAEAWMDRLRALEQECHEVEERASRNASQTSKAESCHALAEVSGMYQKLTSLSERCEAMSKDLHAKIHRFAETVMSPEAGMDAGFHRTIANDPYLSSRCGAALGAAGKLRSEAAWTNAKVQAAVARADDDREKFRKLGGATSVFRSTSLAAAEKCKTGQSAPSSASLSYGAGGRSPVLRHPASAQTITGLEEDAKKRGQ